MKQPNKFGYFIKNNNYFLQITKNHLMDFTNYGLYKSYKQVHKVHTQQ